MSSFDGKDSLHGLKFTGRDGIHVAQFNRDGFCSLADSDITNHGNSPRAKPKRYGDLPSGGRGNPQVVRLGVARHQQALPARGGIN